VLCEPPFVVQDSRVKRKGDFVRTKTLLLFVSFVGLPAFHAYGQVSCLPATPNSTKLVCELPVGASTVAASAVGQSTALANAAGVSAAINSSIGTQLTQLPIPSASVGTVVIQQAGNPFGVPFDNLGPVLTDRPDTVGKHRLFVGFSYQRFNFNAIDGIDLGSLPVGYVSQPTTTSPDLTIYGSESADVNFHLNQYVGLITYGLTKTSDVSVIVPINDVSLAVRTSNFQTYLYDSNANQYSNESLPPGTKITTTGTASGIGDVIVTFKQALLGQEGRPPAVSVGADVRFPTGDALNYLGSGAYGINLHGLFEYRWKLSPHLKLGYQWNTDSQLVNISQKANTQLPGGLQYDAGADYRLNRKLTLAADILGSQFVNTNLLVKTQVNLNPAPPTDSGITATSVTVLSTVPNTYTTANFSAGLKYHPAKHWLFYGNVLVALNNVGLRSDPVPLVGISFIK
jgi:Putative MetA-pathway of phenol degradation